MTGAPPPVPPPATEGAAPPVPVAPVPDARSTLALPELSLVVLIGTSGAGKSTFARTHFRPTEVLSSDACRALVSDDENSLPATTDAFAVLHFIAARRLARGRLTVVDATNVQPEARRPLVALAREHHCVPVAIVLDLPERLCQERNRLRPDRDFGPHVIRRQHRLLRQSLASLRREGFRQVYHLPSPAVVAGVTVVRRPLACDRRDAGGPFDLIGDVHGCLDELLALLERLGYDVADVAGGTTAAPRRTVRHPQGRTAVFLGDLVDRGPRTPDVLRLAMDMVADGTALVIPGNHEAKLLRKLRGADVQVSYGLAETLAQLAQGESPEAVAAFQEEVAGFLDGLPTHYVLDGGRLVVAHAGLKAEMQGRDSGAVRAFALYGETTGETDELGLPVRLNWAADYRGPATVVYGHTPVPEPQWLNHTINVDTGCCFGGRLTALRYPEGELVSVSAAQTYYAPARPLTAPPPDGAPAAGAPAAGALPARSPVAGPAAAVLDLRPAPEPYDPAGPATDGPVSETAPDGVAPLTAQQRHDDLLDLADVRGRRAIATRLRGDVHISEEHAAAALETMTRFAVDPRWLIYLPPTMSPAETSAAPDLLEHPDQALDYFAPEGLQRVVCEEKHMGSRVVAVVCRDGAAARRRFGTAGDAGGVLYTRTGRPCFGPTDVALEVALLERLRAAAGAAGLWEALDTDWLCVDAELLPWSAKAQGLLRGQYAAAGAAGGAALAEATAALDAFAGRDGIEGAAAALLEHFRGRGAAVARYVDAYRRYCWPVTSVADLRLAPFHLLASEGAVHVQRDHVWHMETLATLCRAAPDALLATPYRVVDLDDAPSRAGAVAWWQALTERGGEGMVVKPLDLLSRGRRGLVQPAVKCRGREYLRLIYGPEYTAPDQLQRLRARSVGAKRSLALREFALGIEALERFVRRVPLREVHECVFGVLALESEPVDPRL